MKGTIDIDVGGTFTDAFALVGEKIITKKVPTTGYDLSVCFMKVMEECATDLGVPVEGLLRDTELIRYSTTIAMNKLIERKGPRLGLITTEGFEDTIFIGRGAQWVDGLTETEKRNLARQKKPEPIIPRERVVGVKERVDSTGTVIRPLNEEDVRQKVYRLVNLGCRGFVVSLVWSFVNPAHERRIKEIIQEEFPDYYLGRMPIVLSSEVLPKLGEYERTMTTVLNAYLHEAMREELTGMWDRLRDRAYAGPFMMVHNTGGMAEVFKTTADRTYNGGPVAGLVGSAHLAKKYGYTNVVTADMGGTSFDIGLIAEGSVRFYEFRPIIDRWMVGITLLETRSIGAGGGSIAWINELLGKRVEVGPQSAGSMPGPACYDLGGTEPTVTDADVVLGYIDPGYYYGGRMPLNKDKAVRAVQEKVAKPLGKDVVEAASLIKTVVDGNMGSVIAKETVARGYDPREFVLFAFGGAGPTHCCGFVKHVEVPKVITFPYSPVFCAFGSSSMDIVHIYEQSRRLLLVEPSRKPDLKWITDYALFNGIVQGLMEKALVDIRGEGFPTEKIAFSLEMDMRYGGQIHVKRALSPRLLLKGPEDVKAVYEEFELEFSQTFSPLSVYPEGGVYIDNFILKAILPRPKLELPTFKAASPDPKKALKGKRDAFFEEIGGMTSTNVYQYERLEPGNVVEGPALIEAEYTTTVIPPGRRYVLDEHRFGVIEGL